MAKSKPKTTKRAAKTAAPVASPSTASMAPGVDIGIADKDRKTISQDLA